MPKRKEPELDPKEQAKRFREAAREAEVDQELAEKAFKSLAKDHPKKQASQSPVSRKNQSCG